MGVGINSMQKIEGAIAGAVSAAVIATNKSKELAAEEERKQEAEADKERKAILATNKLEEKNLANTQEINELNAEKLAIDKESKAVDEKLKAFPELVASGAIFKDENNQWRDSGGHWFSGEETLKKQQAEYKSKKKKNKIAREMAALARQHLAEENKLHTEKYGKEAKWFESNAEKAKAKRGK